MNAKTLSRGAVAVAVAVALSAGYVAGHRDVPAPQVIAPAQAAMMPAEAAAKTGIPDFSGLVETYGPAVVNISAKHVVKRTALRGSSNNSQQLPIETIYIVGNIAEAEALAAKGVNNPKDLVGKKICGACPNWNRSRLTSGRNERSWP